MTINIATLFTVSTAAAILKTGLEVAQALGVAVTSWRVDDPTRATFKLLAEILAHRDEQETRFIKSGFLSTAEAEWLTLHGFVVYGVERPAATYAASTLAFANAGGGQYALEAGEVTASSSTSGQTYHNTETLAIALGPGTTTTCAFIADNPGSDGSAGVDEIDTMVTTLLGVSITGSTVAVGADEQAPAAYQEQCRATTGALSPNGPPDAYEYVARNVDLTGAPAVTRARSSEDAPDLTVTVWVATASGAPSGADVALVQAAIDVWSTPLCVTPTVVAATEVEQAVTATVEGNDIPPTVEADCEDALGAAFALLAIGGVVSRSAIIATIHGLLVAAGATDIRVTLTVPAADVELAAGEVATLGNVTVTEV